MLVLGCAIQIGAGNRVLSSDGKSIEAGVAKDFGKENQAEIGTAKDVNSEIGTNNTVGK
jgi:hypothetical protein